MLQFSSIVLFWTPCLGLGVGVGASAGCALVQAASDVKRYIAGSSVIHMLCCSVGMWCGSDVVWVAVILIAVAHSYGSSGLFGLAGSIVEGCGSRCILLLRCTAIVLTLVLCAILMNGGVPVAGS